jgi:rfaE bifunctional protein kinase chain/domain
MKFLDNIKNARVLVVGDVMLDRYWWGDVTRISPEAPVPIVRLNNTTISAGGAANVAVNVAALGATAMLVGTLGSDPEADLVCDILRSQNVRTDRLVRFESRPTTVKTRIIAHGQQVARVDNEVDGDLSDEESGLIGDAIERAVGDADIVVVSDYAKGLLGQGVLSRIFIAAREHGVRVVVDPKGKDYSKYRGAQLITPNRREAAEACDLDDGPTVVNEAGRRLMSDHGFGSVLVTEGEHGMTLFQMEREPVHFDAISREVFDVTGAGDTVIAAIATAVAARADLVEAAEIANIAAGLAVEQVGTAAVGIERLKLALNGHFSRKS